MYVYVYVGPYFFGATPSIVDFTLVPWAYRYYVFETCRGPVQHLHLHYALTAQAHPTHATDYDI